MTHKLNRARGPFSEEKEKGNQSKFDKNFRYAPKVDLKCSPFREDLKAK